MKRRAFFRGLLAGAALTVAAPLLGRRAPAAMTARCDVYPVLILRSDGLRQEWRRAQYEEIAWNACMRSRGPDMSVMHEFRELPKPRGSVIRFRRDPSKVLELS